MLILFDIDGTMLSSEGIGIRSIEEAAEQLFEMPCSLEGIQVGGRLDPLIWNDVCDMHGIKNTPELHEKFREVYTRTLQQNIENVCVEVLPGISGLLEACYEMNHVTMGLVTGNYEETGKLKLQAAGIDHSIFVANAWGTDGRVRSDLPPVAIKQHRNDGSVVLIGDTVHDIASGQGAGCRVIAVCTGSDDRATLARSTPDLLLEDLADTEAVLHWIFNSHIQ
ncbi:MAG: HAD hydrolase-like protein [Planctomycetes bacterium]|nr:HAD hydrolase-like protein [Planctomycetota bacterium]